MEDLLLFLPTIGALFVLAKTGTEAIVVKSALLTFLTFSVRTAMKMAKTSAPLKKSRKTARNRRQVNRKPFIRKRASSFQSDLESIFRSDDSLESDSRSVFSEESFESFLNRQWKRRSRKERGYFSLEESLDEESDVEELRWDPKTTRKGNDKTKWKDCKDQNIGKTYQKPRPSVIIIATKSRRSPHNTECTPAHVSRKKPNRSMRRMVPLETGADIHEKLVQEMREDILSERFRKYRDPVYNFVA